GDVESTRAAAQILWDHDLLITPSLFPAMPLDRGGVRFTVTAANTFGEVEQAIEGLRAVRDHLGGSEPDAPDRTARTLSR
ncbi:MAG: hypothetical protein OEU32_09955, partial [Acidimicrobiia bacterium]|nr:hypothetical protein [Acidimicrobiia bacterium]